MATVLKLMWSCGCGTYWSRSPRSFNAGIIPLTYMWHIACVCKIFIDHYYEVVTVPCLWLQEEQCEFLQFTTGCACLPSADVGQWKMEIKRGSTGKCFIPNFVINGTHTPTSFPCMSLLQSSQMYIDVYQ